jgi:cephalosporin hydroxylase
MEDLTWNYDDYAFTMDFSLSSYGDEYFTAGAKLNIARLFELYGIPSTIIEVGVFEGNTTFWISDTYSQLNKDLIIHAIDPHVGSTDMSEEPLITYNHFTHNLSVNAYKNVNYIRKHSEDGLIDLINQNVQADFIYVDGDHRASGVLSDLILSWKLLKVGGIMLCDDASEWKYTDENGTAAAQMSPRMAIEMFIQCNWHKLKPLKLRDPWQTAFIKIE